MAIDDQSIMAASESGDVYLLSQTSQRIRLFSADRHTAQELAVSPDGKIVVCGGGWHVTQKLLYDDDCRMRVWQLP